MFTARTRPTPLQPPSALRTRPSWARPFRGSAPRRPHRPLTKATPPYVIAHGPGSGCRERRASPVSVVLGTSRAPRPRPTPSFTPGPESLTTSQTSSRAAGPETPETRDAGSSVAGFESHPFPDPGLFRSGLPAYGLFTGSLPEPRRVRSPLATCALAFCAPRGRPGLRGPANPQPPVFSRSGRVPPLAPLRGHRLNKAPESPWGGHRPCPVTPRDLSSQVLSAGTGIAPSREQSIGCLVGRGGRD